MPEQIAFKQQEMMWPKLNLPGLFSQILVMVFVTVVIFVVSPVTTYAEGPLKSCTQANQKPNQKCKPGIVGQRCQLSGLVGTGTGTCSDNAPDGEGGTIGCGCAPGLPLKPKLGGGGEIALLIFAGSLALWGRIQRNKRSFSL